MSSSEPVDERVEMVSADLPYELQSKLFDQLATLGVAGAGLTVTLIGGVLSHAPFFIWLAVIAFAFGAIVALSTQANLIDSLFRRKPSQKMSKTLAGISIFCLSFGIGVLGAAIALESGGDHKHENTAGLGAESNREG